MNCVNKETGTVKDPERLMDGPERFIAESGAEGEDRAVNM